MATKGDNGDSINFGMVFENAVAQELQAHGHESLFSFSSKNIGEVDFLLQRPQSTEVSPVEVKSGARSHCHAALDGLLRVPNYRLGRAVVLHAAGRQVTNRSKLLEQLIESSLDSAARFSTSHIEEVPSLEFNTTNLWGFQYLKKVRVSHSTRVV